MTSFFSVKIKKTDNSSLLNLIKEIFEDWTQENCQFFFFLFFSSLVLDSFSSVDDCCRWRVIERRKKVNCHHSLVHLLVNQSNNGSWIFSSFFSWIEDCNYKIFKKLKKELREKNIDFIVTLFSRYCIQKKINRNRSAQNHVIRNMIVSPW